MASSTTVTELQQQQQQQQQQPSLMMIHNDQRQRQKQQSHRYKNFAHAKDQCLNGSKPDKSSAGRLDAHAIEICNAINAMDAYYTTSSCSGRCFLYTGIGNKSSTDTSFQRFRVSHELIRDASRYFNLATLQSDPTGGGDDIFHRDPLAETESADRNDDDDDDESNDKQRRDDVWLRFEPFILHVACRSLTAASALMSAARPAFKNVGLTSWKQHDATTTSSSNRSSQNHAEKYIVAIWGDEGLDMPLCMPSGCPLVVEQATSSSTSDDPSASTSLTSWLAQLVNERHERNWSKIARFVQAVRDMEIPVDDEEDEDGEDDHLDDGDASASQGIIPRSYDVIGDVALLHKTKTANSINNDNDEDEHQRFKAMGEAVMKKNKAIKVVVLRQSNLVGPERAPGHDDNLMLLAGGPPERMHPSLITTHSEHGISCVVNLHETFFSPRMSRERQRICAQVQDNEDVLVLFAGVCMEALLIAAKTRARAVVAMECNPAAILCARRSQRMLERNNNKTLVPGAAQRLEIVQGDVLQLLPSVAKRSYDRILAPRPKLGDKDGDLGNMNGDDDDDDGRNSESSARAFLAALLPVLKDGGICHWYDFVADHEFPTCQRIQDMLQETCSVVNEAADDGNNGDAARCIKVLHVANAGSVAMRQLRVCIDFCIVPRNDKP